MRPAERARRRAVLKALGFDDTLVDDNALVPIKTLLASLIVMEALGFSHDEIRKMAKRRPSMLRLSPRQVSDVWFQFRLIGFTHAELKRMMLDAPQLWTASLDKVWSMFTDLVAYGFPWHDLIHIVVMEPSILTYAAERNRKVLQNHEQRGFSKEDLVRVTFRAPQFINDDAVRMNERLDFLEQVHGPERARAIIMADPGIVRNDTQRLSQHVDIQRYVGVDPVRRANTNAFSPKLLRGRIVFLEARGQKKWPGCLFESNPQFQARQGISREQLIALDPGPEAFRECLNAKTTV